MSKDWPSIKKPAKPGAKTDVKWDHHMQQWVPMVTKVKKA